MGPALHKKSSVRQHSPHHSPDSSARNYPSPRRSPYQKQRSLDRHKSTVRAHSPVRTSGFHGSKSPSRERLPGHSKPAKNTESRSPRKEKLEEHFRSSRCNHSRSPVKSKEKHDQPRLSCSRSLALTDVSQSPSPRTKRLRRAKADYDADKSMEKDYERGTVRDHGRGKHKEYTEKDMPIAKRSLHENSDGRFSGALRHTRSQSPVERNHRSRHGSPALPKHMEHEEAKSARRADMHRDNDEDSVAKMKNFEEALEVKQKKQPTFELSGKLAEETNRFRGVTLLFTEPPDACKPDIRWRLYVFKAGEALNDPLRVYHQKCYLFGRERRVADIPTDHPSCSKQHAVLQHRMVEKEQPDGLMKKQVRPYLMDLGSTNGTFINDDRIEPQRYYELFEKDTIKFGNSSREYVLLHENSVD